MKVPWAFFISDAHLGVRPGVAEPRRQTLTIFLESLCDRATHVFIVGDLFDFWFEYELLIRRDYYPVVSALECLVRAGVEVHYIAGNHDFALGSFLTDEIGVHIHPDGYYGEIQQRRLVVKHGDGLLSRDIGYRLLRRILRNRFNQNLYRLLHPAIGITLASLASRLSRSVSGQSIPQDRLAAYREAAAHLLVSTPADVVILGHTHTPELFVGARGTYCNTGEWLRQFTFATMSAGNVKLWRGTCTTQAEEIHAQSW